MLLNFRKYMGLLMGMVSLTSYFIYKFIFFILSFDIELIKNRVS
jgi:hypothetical protein